MLLCFWWWSANVNSLNCPLLCAIDGRGSVITWCTRLLQNNFVSQLNSYRNWDQQAIIQNLSFLTIYLSVSNLSHCSKHATTCKFFCCETATAILASWNCGCDCEAGDQIMASFHLVKMPPYAWPVLWRSPTLNQTFRPQMISKWFLHLWFLLNDASILEPWRV